jgi:nicotinamidase/pyrazinamidase
MLKSNTALISIDVQLDFHDNVPIATLAVPGAEKDTNRIAKLIDNLNPQAIFASMDTHYPLDISHTAWFTDAKGNPVSPFTNITASDVLNGKFVPTRDPKRTLTYLQDLEINGEFKHTIWPDHCLQGSAGHALHPVFFKAIQDWMKRNNRWVNFITKGVNPYTEHFGIFRANVPIKEDDNTQVNQQTFITLNQFDQILITGQAQTHCVANSLRQMLQISPQLASKIIVVEDCMSPVTGLPSDFYPAVEKIYSDAYARGVRKQKSTDF